MDDRTVEQKLAKLEKIEQAERVAEEKRKQAAADKAEQAQKAREAAIAAAKAEAVKREAIARAKRLELLPESDTVAEVLKRHPHVKELTRCPHCECSLIPFTSQLAFCLLLLENEHRSRQMADAQKAHDQFMRKLCDRNGIRGVHPFVDMFPMLSQDQLENMAESIARTGQIYSITLDKDGVLLDGRQRLVACDLAGIKPRTEVYEGDDPMAFILSANVRRMHRTPEEITAMLEVTP
jgi:hypothetical protein